MPRPKKDSLTNVPVLMGTKLEILHSMDASKLTPELRELWKEQFLPLLRKLIPGGQDIELAFLADPPLMEIRKPIS